MTTEPFAAQHAIIEAANRRICAAEEQIYDVLARIPHPPGSITPEHHDEWHYSEQAGAYTRYLTMGHWEPAGDGSAGIHVTVDLYAEQTETGALRDWNIGLDGQDGMTAEQARQLAAALLEAATALEASQSPQEDRPMNDRDDSATPGIIPVSPDDIGAVGPDAATIAGLIRQHTAAPGPDRIELGGDFWWVASAHDMDKLVGGIGCRVVRDALLRGFDAGLIDAVRIPRDSGALAYRVLQANGLDQ